MPVPVKPAASSARRIAPTRPSIMSDGATRSTPARACSTAIFARIDAATAALQTHAPLPDYDVCLTQALAQLAGSDLWQIFCRNCQAVNGRTMESVAELATFLLAGGHLHGYCDPALHATLGAALAAAGLTVETSYDRERYDDYQFGITRATGAIAESGTVILDDERSSRRLAALTPWVHVAVLQRHEIHRRFTRRPEGW